MIVRPAFQRSPKPIIDAAPHHTPLGTFWTLWTAAGLYSIEWNPPSQSSIGDRGPQSDGAAPSRVPAFEQALQSYFRGDFKQLSAVSIDSEGWSPFFDRVYRVCLNIPAGETLSYGEVAERAGSPRAARAVGQAMASNRLMLVIPCHRVLASGGRLGGYGGPGGLETKRWLLHHESGCRPIARI